jgi:DNA-directed RNA polymerase specialized sigma24 family protein
MPRRASHATKRATLRTPKPAMRPADEQLVSAETNRAVLAAIEALPPDQRVTVLLFEFDELSYRDVAAIAFCSWILLSRPLRHAARRE